MEKKSKSNEDNTQYSYVVAEECNAKLKYFLYKFFFFFFLSTITEMRTRSCSTLQGLVEQCFPQTCLEQKVLVSSGDLMGCGSTSCISPSGLNLK